MSDDDASSSTSTPTSSSTRLPAIGEPPSGRVKSNKAMMAAELNRLRTLIVQGFTPSQIQEHMHINPWTYRRYFAELARQDKMFLENDKMAKNAALVEISVLKDRFASIIRRCNKIANDDSQPGAIQLQAMQVLAEIATTSAKLGMTGPSIVKSLSPQAQRLATGVQKIESFGAVEKDPPALQAPKELQEVQAGYSADGNITGAQRVNELLKSRRLTGVLQEPQTQEQEEDSLPLGDDDAIEDDDGFDPLTGRYTTEDETSQDQGSSG